MFFILFYECSYFFFLFLLLRFLPLMPPLSFPEYLLCALGDLFICSNKLERRYSQDATLPPLTRSEDTWGQMLLSVQWACRQFLPVGLWKSFHCSYLQSQYFVIFSGKILHKYLNKLPTCQAFWHLDHLTLCWFTPLPVSLCWFINHLQLALARTRCPFLSFSKPKKALDFFSISVKLDVKWFILVWEKISFVS